MAVLDKLTKANIFYRQTEAYNAGRGSMYGSITAWRLRLLFAFADLGALKTL